MTRAVESVRWIANVLEDVGCEATQLARHDLGEQDDVAPHLRPEICGQLRHRLDLGDVEAEALVEILAVAHVLRLVSVRASVRPHDRRACNRPRDGDNGHGRLRPDAPNDRWHVEALESTAQRALQPLVDVARKPCENQRRPPPPQIDDHVREHRKDEGKCRDQVEERQRRDAEAKERSRIRDVVSREERRVRSQLRHRAYEKVAAEDERGRENGDRHKSADAVRNKHVLDARFARDGDQRAPNEPRVNGHAQRGERQQQDARPPVNYSHDVWRATRRFV